MNIVTIGSIPTQFRWETPPQHWEITDTGSLIVRAGAHTDLFIDPQGTSTILNAPRLQGQLSGDFLLSARVTVNFQSTYDAGVLLVWAGERTWGKLCFEYSPQGQPMIVSVVTRGVSDDCNSFDVQGNQVWLRIARIGQAIAFHASSNGTLWHFVRYFALDNDGPISVGFEAQSPTGEGCQAIFDHISYRAQRLTELRDGQ